MNLLQMSFSGAILILAVIVVRTISINKLPKITFLVLWGIVLLRLLIPFSVHSMLSVYSLVNRSMPVSEIVSDMPVSDYTPTVQPAQAGQIFIGDNTVQMPQDVQNNVHVSVWIIIWCIGTIICAAFFIISYLRWSFEFKTSLPVTDTFITQWLKEHRLKRPIAIRQSDRIKTPLTYGILQPVILMPGKTDWENKQQLQYILLHEYVHICRYDIVMKLISAAALCIHWFNPMVWAMYILFNRDIELACDECVIRKFGEDSKSEYALTLISMEEKKSGLMPICNNFSKNAIEERITAVMKIKKTSFAAIIVSVALVASVTTAFATSAITDDQQSNAIPAADLPDEDDCISIANKCLNSIINDYWKIENIVYTGFVDVAETPIEINNVQYYSIENECNSIDELVQLMSNVYTEAQIEKILSWCTDGDEPLIIEYEGKLWRQEAYAMGTPFILPINEAEKVDNNTLEVVTESDGNEDFLVKIILKIEGNKWKIDGIEEIEKEQ